MMCKRKMKNALAIVLIVCITITFMPIVANTYQASAASSKITTSGLTKPKEIKQGGKFILKGTIKSKLTITKVEIGITNSSGSAWLSGMKYTKKKVKAKSFNVFKADSSIKFGKLKAGTYYYRIWAHDANGAHRIVNQSFKVVAPKPAPVAAPTSSLKDKFVAQALSYEGKTGSYFGFTSLWCANFVEYCSKKVGASSKIPTSGANSAYDISRDVVNNKGGIVTFVDSECYNERVKEKMFNSSRVYYNSSYKPKKGDLLLVFYNTRSKDGSYYHYTFKHIGIVYADDGNWKNGFPTIEGNMASKVSKYTSRLAWGSDKIGAFVTPAW